MGIKVTRLGLGLTMVAGLLAIACSSPKSTPISQSSVPPSPTNPIQQFNLFVDTDGFAFGNYLSATSSATEPFPTVVPAILGGENIFVFIMDNASFLGDRTLSKMTLLDPRTGIEVPLVSAEGGYQNNPNIPMTFTSPQEKGIYEVRLYYKDLIVASESFQVYKMDYFPH
jgi:hypothetical protein